MHHSGEVSTSSLQLRPASSSPQAAKHHLLSLDRLFLFLLKHRNLLPTAKLTRAQGWQWWSTGGEVKRKRKKGKEKRKEGTSGEKNGKLHFSPPHSTKHTKALNFQAFKPLLSQGQFTRFQGARDKTTKEEQTPTHQEQQELIFHKYINSNYIMENQDITF